MGWAIGYLDGRDVGYGVPAVCESPDCKVKIDRGLAYKCGEWRSDDGCGLYFCYKHLVYATDSYDNTIQFCEPCAINVHLNSIDPNTGYESFVATYDMKPDVKQWVRHKLNHASWKQWRDENQDEVNDLIKLYPDIKIRATLSRPERLPKK
jgi:hypothetical protein